MAEGVHGGMTVLVADPDLAQQQQLIACLRPRYRVITAKTLAETSEMITRYRPDILLLEVEMPDGDGRGFVRQLRENGGTRQMIVCCVTRRATVRDKVAGFQAGADDYVIKPINPNTFLWRVVLLTRVRQMNAS
jgi:DNA-binding response OmpR family regulator